MGFDIVKMYRNKVKKLRLIIKKKALYNRRLKARLEFLEKELQSSIVSNGEYRYTSEHECAISTFCENLLEDAKKFNIG